MRGEPGNKASLPVCLSFMKLDTHRNVHSQLPHQWEYFGCVGLLLSMHISSTLIEFTAVLMQY